jgi:D-alanyl-D-alanine carboxypeptidase
MDTGKVWTAYYRTLEHARQLDPVALERAAALLDACWQVGIPAWISSSRRSEAEQRELVRTGKSQTMHSAHLDGRAFDIDVVGYRRDDVPLSFWNELGPLGESIGLRWGGRWRTLVDLGHFEVPLVK